MKAYASDCCKAEVKYSGPHEFSWTEIFTMSATCSACNRPCTPIDVKAVLERHEQLFAAVAEVLPYALHDQSKPRVNPPDRWDQEIMKVIDQVQQELPKHL